MSWTVQDHTADVLLALEAADWRELLGEAARCFGEFVGGGALPAGPRVQREIEVDGVDAAETWVRYWRALHRLWVVEELLPVAACVAADASALRTRAAVACLPAEALDASRCVDVKAITWHGAQAEAASGRWRGRIVLDV